MEIEAVEIEAVEIERFRAEDQDAVRRLILDGLEAHWGVLDPGLNPDLDDIEASYAEGTVVVARRAERIVGAAAVVPVGPGTGEVKRMSVARDAQRQGIGAALLTELVADAERRGCHRLVLETTADWEDAVGFYLAFGFALTHYEDGPFGRDAYFSLDLASDAREMPGGRPASGDNRLVDPATERVRAHFDDLGDGEWERLESTLRGRVSFEIHRRLLAETISPGDRVLEIGAGPGRFTIELARLGAHVTVTDLSAVQLELNELHTTAAGCEHAVANRFLLDVRDVATLGESAFDAVVAFGGPLSYVFEDAERAFGHTVNAVRPGGVVVASVMAAPGTLRYFLPAVVDEILRFGVDVYDHVFATGDLRAIPGSHTCRMFRWREVESMIAAQPCVLLAASAGNCLSLGDAEALERVAADPGRWDWFVNWEASLCREPGLLDAGTHVLFAVQRT